jgi:CHASE2 domain-containing sensor protein
MEILETLSSWFMGLGDQYGVNPFIFGAIYIGAIPIFTVSVAWIVRNYKKKRPITLPVLSASACFVSAYVYLMIAGENVPWWVYAVVIGMLVYGAWSTYNKVQNQIKEETNEV